MTTKQRLLDYFESHKGDVLTRDDIFSAVWGYKKDSKFFNEILNNSRTLDVHVSKLRKDGYHIETIHSVGYRFNGKLKEVK